MKEDSKNIIIQAKNARIITILAEKFDGSLDKAMEADEIYREYAEVS